MVVSLKSSFRVRFPLLMTDILKIILFKNDEKLACLLTAFYEIAIDDDMLFRALEKNNFIWLQYVWSFKKNFLGPRSSTDVVYITYT